MSEIENGETKEGLPSGWENWREEATSELKRSGKAGFGEQQLLYTAADTRHLPETDTVPGSPPYLRGARASMYTGRPWTLRQYAGYSTARESNEFYRRNLKAGQRGLSVAFDLATHRGFDSDHPRVEGDVGKAGVAVDCVEDMAELFDSIPLGKTSVSMTMNGAVLPVLAMFVVAAEEQGASQAQLSGTIQNDVLKEFMVRNTFIYPPEPSMRIVGDIIEYASREMPRFNPVSISGYHMHEAGAPAHLELAFTLADGLSYVRSAVERGLNVDSFASRLSFFFAVGSDFFTEIAKLRAARLLWSRLMKEHFQPKDPASLRLRMHCQTSGVSLTAQQPHNNVVRTALQALCAVLGGTQSLHTNAFDEALALPSDFAAEIARNTQLILQHETGVADVIDPLGGSYYLESLTHSLVAQAEQVMEEIEQSGGMTVAVADGWPRSRIVEAATRRQARIERGLDIVVGVNRFQETCSDAPPVDIRAIDNEQVRRQQIARLQQVRQARDSQGVARALDALEAAARTSDRNLLPLAMDAVRARATVGEVSLALEKVWGRHVQQTGTVTGVYSQYYEGDEQWAAVQARVGKFEQGQGRRPRLLVAKLGQDGHDRGARLIATAFADAGFDVDVGPLFQTPGEVAQQAIDNDVHVVGVSTQAAGHLTLMPQLIESLGALGAQDIVTICGGVIPDADRAPLAAAGVALVFGPGTPIVEAIDAVLTVLFKAVDKAP